MLSARASARKVIREQLASSHVRLLSNVRSLPAYSRHPSSSSYVPPAIASKSAHRASAFKLSSHVRHSTSNAASAAQQKACIRCSTAMPLSTLSCTSCDALQPLPSELDAYQLMGLDRTQIGSNGWDVDVGELKSIWRKALSLSHPDRMGGRSEKEQQIAAQQSSMLNKAYETLREPLQRAHLLLELHASSAPSEADSLDDPETLMEVMDLREELEGAASEEEAAAVRERNRKHLVSTADRLRAAFASSPPNVEDARKSAIGLRYWSNIDTAAREWQPGKRVEVQH